jgi:hypothetical protein
LGYILCIQPAVCYILLFFNLRGIAFPVKTLKSIISANSFFKKG